MDCLYHYGSNRRCFGILSEKAVRMSDIRKSNDLDEITMFFPGIFNEIESQYKSNPFELKYEDKSGEEALYNLINATKEMIGVEINTGAFSNFVVCFSEVPDLLSQWRGYANDRKGCCIGFSLDTLKEYCKKSKIIRIEKIKYITDEQRNTIMSHEASEAITILKDLRSWIVDNMTFDDSNPDTDGLLGFNFYGTIESILTNSLKYKGRGFREEKEWRLFLSRKAYKNSEWVLGEECEMTGPNGFPETISFLRNRIQFNITEDNISPYIPLNFCEFPVNPVKEIWLGPKSHILESDLKLFLAKQGFGESIDIFQSQITYI